MFRSFKRYLPSGLYGRVALILVLPVVLLWLVVSIVFIQRHFEGVTEQMSRAVISELSLLSARLIADQGLTEATENLAKALNITIETVAADAPDLATFRHFYDLTGLVVVKEFELLDSLVAVNLDTPKMVHLRLELAGAYFDIEFSRDRVSPSNPHQLIVNMVVFGVFFTLIAFIYLRNQLRPITRLAAAAEAFGRGRTLPYHPSGAIEVRAAGRAFLDMRARIERHIEQRTMILSGVSHDLRTPLTRLKLGLSMLEHDDRKLLERDVDEMRQLLDEFLSFAREQGDEGGKSEATNPFELVQMIVHDTTRAGYSVSLRCKPSAILVEMRPLAIKRALENLIMNAVRYGTKAVVDLQYDARSLMISVEDNGPSIPPELYEEAMKPFSRLDPARNQNKGSGVGLGLPIAADIARAHGGRVELSESGAFGGLCASLIISR